MCCSKLEEQNGSWQGALFLVAEMERNFLPLSPGFSFVGRCGPYAHCTKFAGLRTWSPAASFMPPVRNLITFSAALRPFAASKETAKTIGVATGLALVLAASLRTPGASRKGRMEKLAAAFLRDMQLTAVQNLA